MVRWTTCGRELKQKTIKMFVYAQCAAGAPDFDREHHGACGAIFRKQWLVFLLAGNAQTPWVQNNPAP